MHKKFLRTLVLTTVLVLIAIPSQAMDDVQSDTLHVRRALIACKVENSRREASGDGALRMQLIPVCRRDFFLELLESPDLTHSLWWESVGVVPLCSECKHQCVQFADSLCPTIRRHDEFELLLRKNQAMKTELKEIDAREKLEIDAREKLEQENRQLQVQLEARRGKK